ncbi:hypothetical protein OH492_18035 [Vibrio chagasii]|nr:hypothetical protein [Vibrio chagasii]
MPTAPSLSTDGGAGTLNSRAVNARLKGVGVGVGVGVGGLGSDLPD